MVRIDADRGERDAINSDPEETGQAERDRVLAVPARSGAVRTETAVVRREVMAVDRANSEGRTAATARTIAAVGTIAAPILGALRDAARGDVASGANRDVAAHHQCFHRGPATNFA